MLPRSIRSFNSSTSNLTNQIRSKLKEIERFKNCSISDRGGTGNIVHRAIEDTDIEHVVYLYDDELPIEVQLWDQVKGQSHDTHSQYFFSQSYLQGKNGVIFLINPDQPTDSVNRAGEIIDSAN